MTAQTRRDHAANHSVIPRSDVALDLWRRTVQIRQEWLGHGLSTRPADTVTAEQSLTAIYARISRPAPRFEWVDSPYKALPLVGGFPTLDLLNRWIRHPHPPGTPPLASDLATAASLLRGALGQGVVHSDPELSPPRQGKKKQPWPQLPPREALAAGVPMSVVLHQGTRSALYRSLAYGFYLPVRAALASHGPVPVCWYGQQDAAWIAYYDLLRRLGLARYGPDETEHLGHWAALVRSCGWWWPGEDICVVVERPSDVRTEPLAGAWHDEVRLRHDGVEYRDGWHPRIN